MSLTDIASNSQAPVALLTGVGRRLGHYLALQLIRRGYRVIGSYRSARPQLAELRDAGVELLQCDFNDVAATSALASQLAERLPRLDLLLHNASAFGPTHSELATAAAEFEQFFRVHMLAPWLLTEALAPALAASDNGCVVAITDIYVNHPNPALAAYCSSKAGLDSLCQSWVRRLAPKVRVNSIQPGPILFLDEHDAAYRQQILARTPLQREGGLEPIAQTLWLILDNHYLTGARIPVDGGRAVAEL